MENRYEECILFAAAVNIGTHVQPGTRKRAAVCGNVKERSSLNLAASEEIDILLKACKILNKKLYVKDCLDKKLDGTLIGSWLRNYGVDS